MIRCPEMDMARVNLTNTELSLDWPYEFDIKIVAADKEEDWDELHINSPSIGLKADFYFDDSAVEGHFWSLPLTDDKRTYFMNNKKFGINILGNYTYNGVEYECSKEK
jgi:hypothetical protein